MSSSSVFVGRTDFPLRSLATARGPVASFPHATSGQAFHLLDGPPYANGAPHLGHVLNKHLKDAVARAAHALGHDLTWRPGWDCHGLPLELAVERAQGRLPDRGRFLAAARALATEQASLQAGVFQEQGWSADWEQPWHTHDPEMEAGTLRVWADLVERGAAVTRRTAVPWCAQCGSTLSGAEQEDKALTQEAWLVPFELAPGEVMLSWTTTPWTLPLHQALVVHPETVYEALSTEHGLAWVSSNTAAHWAGVLGAQRTGATRVGQDWEGQAYRTPWSQGQVRVSALVQPAGGTGVLHAVPGLAELDTYLGAEWGYHLHEYLDPHGRLTQSPCPEQVGQQAGPAANAPVLGAYVQGPWFRVLSHTADHPHCWRHHTPMLTRASRQVFLPLTAEVRARAETMVGEMAFTPANASNRLRSAMACRPDWCVSRQRRWGVPLALFLDKVTQAPHPRAAVWMRRVADAVAVEGVEAWWNRPSSDWVQDEAPLDTLERVDDVLDVWFDSGCVPQLLGQADVVVEGADQHRGWFQSCVWLAALLGRQPPFKRVVCHGFVVDERGRKLSKSEGGDGVRRSEKAPPPWHQWPTDVVRTWAMAGSEGHEKAWTTDTVQAAQGMVARWRGVLRFLLSNALPAPASSGTEPLPAWDRYWWHRSEAVSQQVLEMALEGRTGEAVTLAAGFAEQFSAVALGSWKDRLYCAPPGTPERQSLDRVVRGCLRAWGRMLEVLTPRLREEAQVYWPTMGNVESCPPLSESERLEVEAVLGVRATLAPVMEQWAKSKGGPGARCVTTSSFFPSWPGQMLADALDVGHLGQPTDVGLQVVLEEVEGKPVLWAGPSPYPLCPRCRRAQPEWAGEHCQPCAVRLG